MAPAIQNPYRVSLFVKDRKSTRLNSSHTVNSYAVFCLKKKHALDQAQHTRRNAREGSRDLVVDGEEDLVLTRRPPVVAERRHASDRTIDSRFPSADVVRQHFDQRLGLRDHRWYEDVEDRDDAGEAQHERRQKRYPFRKVPPPLEPARYRPQIQRQ